MTLALLVVMGQYGSEFRSKCFDAAEMFLIEITHLWMPDAVMVNEETEEAK